MNWLIPAWFHIVFVLQAEIYLKHNQCVYGTSTNYLPPDKGWGCHLHRKKEWEPRGQHHVSYSDYVNKRTKYVPVPDASTHDSIIHFIIAQFFLYICGSVVNLSMSTKKMENLRLMQRMS